MTFAAMDGGAFVTSPSVGNIGKARRISMGPRVLMQLGEPLPSSGCGVIIVVLVCNLVNEDYLLKVRRANKDSSPRYV